MRSKKAIINTIFGLSYVIISIICGLIIPRLILSNYGSNYNGITSSIVQFLSGIALLKAGIGGVTRAALYRPLSENDVLQISKIVKTTENFMRKIASIFVVLVLIFSIVYPILVKDEFNWFFTSTLVIILSISTFTQYFFGFTYQMLLQSDQKQSILYLVQIGTNILSTIIESILILTRCSIHIVMLGSALVYAINPLIINYYSKKRYRIRKYVEVDNKLVSQRWDAFGQEIAFFVHNNTDLIILTIFTNLYEVSVYTVYNYVVKGIRQIIVMCVTGFEAAFGDMLARGELELAEKNLQIYELIVFSLVSIIFTVAGIMIVPYTILYTKGVNDVNYARPVFAFMIILAGAFSCLRIPYKTISDAAGHFKQTRNGALIEAVLNILISIITVKKLGLIGVTFGTLFATVFRSFQYAIYLSENVIKRKIGIFFKHLLIASVSAGITWLISRLYMNSDISKNIVQWVLATIVTTGISINITLILNIIFYKKTCKELLQKVKYIFSKKIIFNE